MGSRGLALAAAAVMTLVLAPVALGDGDPASDVLVSQAAFVPSDTGATHRQNAQLLSVLRAAQRAGFPVRVAIIPDSYDLGSVTALWRRPRDYARFLGIELADVYRQRLLVVMPNGIGFDWQGHPSGTANGQLATIPATSSSGGLLGAAETAVRSLEASAGVRLVPGPQPSARSSARSGGGSAVVAIVAIAAVLLLMAAGAVALRRRSGRRRRSAPAAAPPAAGQIRPRWLVPGFAVLVCLATGLPIVAVLLLRHRGATPAIASTRVPTPYRWAPGQRRAPDFRLIDQDGRPIRLAAFRGRPVILTFVDPLCRNLCPLAAHVLNDVDATLPADERPAIIAVSVDIYADKRADLLEDFHKWDLVPQWHWAVGSPGQLAAVWKHYEIGVSVATKRIAGTTVHYITHDEVAYVIDSAGYVRALFGWPYYPQDVTTVLRQVSRA
jgi:cytochrome oxidase Cu insertion factor (SCO1/SenC/PrrC family)